MELKNASRSDMFQRHTRGSSTRYKQHRKAANKLCRRKKREYLKKHIENIEALRGRNESRKFYHAVKKMNAGFQPNTLACRDKNGTIMGKRVML